MKNPMTKTLILIVAVIAFGAGIGLYSSNYYTRQISSDPQIAGLLWPNPKQLRPFATIDHNNQVFGLEQLQGKWSWLFFGFTNCPDICPNTLQVMNEVHEQLKNHSSSLGIQTLFVSVDPERDTSEELKQYVEYFHPEFIGLGGNLLQVQSLASQIGVAYGKSDIVSELEYQVDHTASLFLIDPEGRFVGVFSSPHDSESILAKFHNIRKFVQNQQG